MNKNVRYTKHLLYRIKVRRFDPDTLQNILKTAQEFFLDTATGNQIAIGTAEYAGKARELAVAFREKRIY